KRDGRPLIFSWFYLPFEWSCAEGDQNLVRAAGNIKFILGLRTAAGCQRGKTCVTFWPRACLRRKIRVFRGIRSLQPVRQLIPAFGDAAGVMTLSFTLCPECLAQYSSLTHDPTCRCGLSSIPFCSLVWPDEHPKDGCLGITISLPVRRLSHVAL